jgi:hypothetical protein
VGPQLTELKDDLQAGAVTIHRHEPCQPPPAVNIHSQTPSSIIAIANAALSRDTQIGPLTVNAARSVVLPLESAQDQFVEGYLHRRTIGMIGSLNGRSTPERPPFTDCTSTSTR